MPGRSRRRSGYHTPHGSFGIQRMEVMHRSHKYYNSPMPHSLFFTGGYAIHGTYETASLGQRRRTAASASPRKRGAAL